MVDEFLEGLLSTIKSHSFFTDWEKARRYQSVFKDELALLSSLSGSKEPKTELSRLIKKYPRINALIPLLSAIRIKHKTKAETPMLQVLDEDSAEDKQYFFAEEDITSSDIETTVEFADKTGLLEELTKVKNHSDYYFGVEVGLDTNARKNRSGTAMEELVEPYIRELVVEHNGILESQKTFEKAGKLFGVEVPPAQKRKNGDFMLFVKKQPTNIEVNYFDGSGSKQEIMNSYISRKEDLAKSGWKFALVTDGLGWRGNRAQIEHGYKRIGNIFNIKMCREGKLKSLLNN